MNNAAKYGGVPFYILVPDLQQEADVVDYNVRAYDLERDIQRKYTILEKKIQTAWDKYTDGDITTSHFLKMISGLYKSTNNDLNESLVKEEREYVMLNECKLNNSCKSGNRVL